MKGKISVGLVLLGIVCTCTALGEGAHDWLVFERAIVNMEIVSDCVHVEGKFFVRNFSEQDQYIVGFPFQIDEYMSYPFSIKVFIGNNQIHFEKADSNTIKFKINIRKLERKTILIDYSQRLKEDKEKFKITYITRTVRTWSRPLKNEKFIVKIPNRYTIEDISFPVRRIKSQGEFTICYIDIDDFYPDNDLTVDLRVRNFHGSENGE